MQVFKVIHPGLFSTVQDLGRFHYRQFDIPPVGAMDSFALRIANILVGNHEHDAALETTVLGPRLLCLEDTAIAITGGDLGFTLNDTRLPMWQVIGVGRGDLIVSKGLRRGCRAYISVMGGVDVPLVMGSRSTDLKFRIGGIEGRALRAGDILESGEPIVELSRVEGRKAPDDVRSAMSEMYPGKSKQATDLRVIMGPYEHHFFPDSIETFLNSEYVVTPQSDRDGYRLSGPEIKHNSRGHGILSSPLAHGTIQVPGNAQPIIFLAGRSVGGYAVIAAVISVDLSKIGQLKPGDKVRFQKVSVKEAHAILRRYEEDIARFRSYFKRGERDERSDRAQRGG